jgi:hypothetical protein
MTGTARAAIDRQVWRVRRRLLWQTLVLNLLSGWSAALLLATVWFVLRPLAFAALGEAVRWTIPAALVGVSTLAALVMTYLKAPNRIAAALALDERFALRERVTTLVTLSPAQAGSSVGQALLQDVHTRVGSLNIATRFPLTLPWRTTLVPLGALALAGAACSFDPFLSGLRFGFPGREGPQAYDAKEIQQQLDTLRKVSALPKNVNEPRTEEFKELESEWDKLINRQLDVGDQEKVRERVSELRKLEDKLKDRLESLKEKAEKTDAFKRELDKLAGDKKLQEGPAKDFRDALAKGKFGKAKDVLEKLQKELKNGNLTKEQQKKLAEEFKQIQQQLQRLVEENEQLKQLQKDLADGKLDREQMERAMEQFKEMQDLGNLVGDLAQGLGRGNGEAIGEALGRLLENLGDIELSDEELKKLLKCDKDLDAALKLLLKACEGDCDGLGNGLGKGKRPGAKRPIDPNDPDTKPKNERQKAEPDLRGQQRITGFVRGGSFNKIPARAVDGAFQQAVQEAPEAIDRQRIPDDAADIARGYFRKLGNHRE